MFRTSVLTLLYLFVQLSHPYHFDIVVGADTHLEFYHKGLRYIESVQSRSGHDIISLTYDPVHDRVLFADSNYPNTTIYSFDRKAEKVQHLVTRTTTRGYNVRIVYEVVTQVLYWKEGFRIYSFPLDRAYPHRVVDGDLIVSVDHRCEDLAVDSCGGYIYWITYHEIERARLDGSKREVIIDSKVAARYSLVIDQQTQRMYWAERKYRGDNHVSIESADFNGKDRTTLYIVRDRVLSLTVSRDFIYWQIYEQEGIWQLPKKPTQQVARQLYYHSISRSYCEDCHRIAAKYTIKEQILGIKSCRALQGLIPYNSSEPAAPICQNYCFQGECSVSAEGQPTCSCKAGYSGERCEVSACHQYCNNGGVCSLNKDNEPACQCKTDYSGERCDVFICKNYCIHGNCSVGAEGQRKCSCRTGYSGERCEVNACHKHCLNGGVCSLNEEGELACQCTADYDGGRCEIPAHTYNRCDAANSGEEKVSACHQFCLNDGICSLNESSEPVCQCTADYEGERCDVPAFFIKWFLYAYKNVSPVTLSTGAKPTLTSTVVKNELKMRSR